MGIPKPVEDRIKAQALVDLEPSRRTVFLKATAASLLGGFLSMFFCGQFGLSLGVWAFDFSQHMPMDMSPVSCAIFCGVIFSILPVLLMRFVFFPPLQFRAAIQRYAVWLMLPYVIWIPILASQGNFSHVELELGLWFIAAIISTMLNARLLRNIFPRISLYRI